MKPQAIDANESIHKNSKNLLHRSMMYPTTRFLTPRNEKSTKKGMQWKKIVLRVKIINGTDN